MDREFVRLLLPIPLLAAFAQAQPYPAKDADGVKALLASSRLINKAWGAYSAAQLQDPSLREPVIAQLRWAESLRDAPRGTEEFACLQALLDSLIQLRAEVPVDSIMPFAVRWRPEMLILLAARTPGPQDEAALLKLREEPLDEAEWLAVNNLLLRQHSAALFRKLVEEIVVTHTLVAGKSQPGGIAGDFGRGGSRVRSPEGYPPVGRYQLELREGFGLAPDAVLLIRGPSYAGSENATGDVFYRRILVPTDGSAEWPNPNFRNTDRQSYRRAYLADLGGISVAQSDKVFRPVTDIDWRSAADFRSKAQAAMAAQERAIIEFVAATARRNGFDSPTDVRIVIEPIVEDRRVEYRPPPLPIIAAKEFIIN